MLDGYHFLALRCLSHLATVFRGLVLIEAMLALMAGASSSALMPAYPRCPAVLRHFFILFVYIFHCQGLRLVTLMPLAALRAHIERRVLLAGGVELPAGGSRAGSLQLILPK